jgi:CubicO group peptidase (beta-lactamase class C family)
MRQRRLVLICLLILAAVPADSQSQSTAKPAPPLAPPSGFAPDRLARIDRWLQEYVDKGQLPGAVALVLRDGRTVYERAVGWADKEANRRMTPDAIFRIASQSKAITSTAVLMLMEEGKLELADAVSRYLPTFAKTTIVPLTGDPAPSKRPITIRDLLTHTAGISYGGETRVAPAYIKANLGAATAPGFYTADKDEPICVSMERLGTLPFVAQPGEAWVYGYNTDILGCVVERVSGQPLDEFIRTRITTPLGMRDTYFYLPTEKRTRLTAVYASGQDRIAVRAPDGGRGQGHYVEGPRKSFAGGAGLLSTARDYARFLEMIRRGGALDGVRILAPKTVALMTTNLVGTLHSATGLGHGLAFETVDQAGAGGLSSVGSFGWGGAYGSWYRVDPTERLTMVLMIQMFPNNTDVRTKFPTMVYQALTETK